MIDANLLVGFQFGFAAGAIVVGLLVGVIALVAERAPKRRKLL